MTGQSNDEVLFSSLLDLIKHLEDRDDKIDNFHLVALGSLGVVTAYLVTLGFDWSAMGVLLLAILLSVHWSVESISIDLQKRCWISAARVVESRLFLDTHGPFRQQETFFKDLDNQSVGLADSFIFETIRLKAKARLAPLLALAVLLLGAGALTTLILNR